MDAPQDILNLMPKKSVAAFDFDVTITTCDTLIPFLRFVHGHCATLGKLLRLTPHMIGYALNIIQRQQLKESILTSFFKGIPKIELQELGTLFSQSKSLSQLIRPNALKRIHWHRQQGHLCVLVSAAIDPYIVPWGISAGFNHVLCSKLESDSNGLLTGKLHGINCRRNEKTRRLQEVLGCREEYILYAYGDSEGDQELLSMADHPFYRFF